MCFLQRSEFIFALCGCLVSEIACVIEFHYSKRGPSKKGFLHDYKIKMCPFRLLKYGHLGKDIDLTLGKISYIYVENINFSLSAYYFV